MIRLQKFLAECGAASRRGAEELILDGQIMVNGKRVTELGTKVDPEKDQVRLGRRFVRPLRRGILLFNKPREVVSTRSDPEGRATIADFLPLRFKSYFTVGRLDYDSSGLVVLTNDGELAERLMHPRFEIKRVYQVRVFGQLTPETQARVKKGVKLHDGIARAEIHFIKRDAQNSWLEVHVAEGRNRLVRRLLEAVGLPVGKLKRLAHGPFKLGSLKNGELRELPESDYLAIREQVLTSSKGSLSSKRARPSRPTPTAKGTSSSRRSPSSKRSPNSKRAPSSRGSASRGTGDRGRGR